MSENNPQVVPTQPFQPAAVAEPYTGYAYPAAPVAQRRGLGIAALIISIVVFVVSLIWAADNGVAMMNALGPNAGTDFGSGFEAGMALGADGAALSMGLILHVVLGTIVGVGAIVLGILAIALKRGRAQGVAAVVIAAIAPFVSLVAYSVAGAFASL
jgi:hypothetical protein